MKTNKYEIEYAGRRRSTWKRRVGCWLWTVIACVLAWWAIRLIWAVAATLGAQAGTPRLRAAGFGVPEWLAVGIVVCVVLGVLARLWWGKVLDAEERSTFSDERWDPYAGDGREVFTTTDDRWMDELVAWFGRRHVMLTREQARDIRQICVPDHRRALVELDHYLRKRMMLRLWMTSLLEVQQICLRSEPEALIVYVGKEGAL